MTSVEFLEKISDVLQVLYWLPSVLITAVTFPLHQVVSLLADLLFVNNSFNCVNVIFRIVVILFRTSALLALLQVDVFFVLGDI